MARIHLYTKIYAPAELCFDLSRDIDLHTTSMKHSIERAIAGTTSGLINLNETVTWEAKHFGLIWRHTSRITAFEFPMFFVDEMEEGAFKYLQHVHKFHQRDGFTLMEDEFTFAAPFGFLGRIVDALILEDYMKNLLIERNRIIKHKAEEMILVPKFKHT